MRFTYLEVPDNHACLTFDIVSFEKYLSNLLSAKLFNSVLTDFIPSSI